MNVELSVWAFRLSRFEGWNRRVLRVSFALAAFISAVAAWRVHAAHQQREFAVGALEQPAAAASPMGPVHLETPVDFSQQLPMKGQLPQFALTLQREAAAAGVLIKDIQARDTPSTLDALGRAELTLRLRGSYLAERQVIREVLSRHPHVTMRNLRMQRAEAGPEVEATLVLSVWSRAEATPSPVSR